MKKTLNFSKGFIPCTILSIAIIIFGLVGMFTRGVNLGIDFKPGLIEEVRVAPPVAEVTYSGAAKVSLDLSAGQLDVILSGVGTTNETRSINFNEVTTVQALADELTKIDGVSVNVKNGSFPTTKLFLNSAATNQLTTTTLYIYPAGTSDITTDDVRDALSSIDGISIKQLGNGADASYQIRAGVDGEESGDVNAKINEKLYSRFGKEKVAIVKTDFIGSSFSHSIMIRSIIMFVLTVLLIWVYAAIRFHWDFALGAIIALVHDCLILFTFIIWFQLEFTTTTLAAVLTIFGYSINATVVILDRIRENIRFVQTKDFNDIINKSVSGTLGRSIITTVTTLFASTALIVFTTGSIHDFAIVLTVGLISGCYSSMFISSGFISFVRRNWKPEYKGHVHQPKAKKEVTIQLDD